MTHDPIRIPVNVSDGNYRWHCFSDITPDLARQIVALGQAEPLLGAAHQSELERAHDEAQVLIESLHRKGNQEAARLANIIAKLRTEADTLAGLLRECRASVMRYGKPGLTERVDAMLKERKP
jgi:hypothetical protein